MFPILDQSNDSDTVLSCLVTVPQSEVVDPIKCSKCCIGRRSHRQSKLASHRGNGRGPVTAHVNWETETKIIP